MPLVIFEGPEAAGKTTIIEALITAWSPQWATVRSNGPKESWLLYCQPLFEDLVKCEEYPTRLIVWSRAWASRTVYNKLLSQGQVIPPEVTRELDEIVRRSGGLLYMVTSPEKVLLERRLRRVEEGSSKPDHQLDVGAELAEFQRFARGRHWQTISGLVPVETQVRGIIHSLVLKNPECRMMDERTVKMT